MLDMTFIYLNLIDLLNLMESNISSLLVDGQLKKIMKLHKLATKKRTNTHSHTTFLSSEFLIGNEIT